MFKEQKEGSIPENIRLYADVSNVPESAKTFIKFGRHQGLIYVKPQYIVEALTERFGICGFGWSAAYDVVDQNQDQIVVVKCSLKVRINGEWSEAIEGFGTAYVKSFDKGTGKWSLSDDSYKVAQADSLRKASFNLGFASSLFDNEEEEYENEEKEESAKENVEDVSYRPKEETENETSKDDNKEKIEKALVTQYEPGKTIKDFISKCKTTQDKIDKLIWLTKNRPEAKESALFLISCVKVSKSKTS